MRNTCRVLVATGLATVLVGGCTSHGEAPPATSPTPFETRGASPSTPLASTAPSPSATAGDADRVDRLTPLCAAGLAEADEGVVDALAAARERDTTAIASGLADAHRAVGELADSADEFPTVQSALRDYEAAVDPAGRGTPDELVEARQAVDPACLLEAAGLG